MTTWPELGALELLVAVADHGSVSAGARAVGMAQPNASRSISRLERQLGVALLHRATTGATMTPAGMLVVDWARGVVAQARELLEGAHTLAGPADPGTSNLVVTASQTVAEHLLPRWLAALRAQHPELPIDVRVHNSRETLDDVLSGRCDVGFVEGPEAPTRVNHLVVAEDELVLVVPPGHPWAGRAEPVSADELAATPLVTREPGSGTRVALDVPLTRATGRTADSLIELPSNAAVRVSVQAGAAPAVLSRLAVTDAVASGALRIVPTELDLRRPLRAVWTGPRRMHGPAADLVATARRMS